MTVNYFPCQCPEKTNNIYLPNGRIPGRGLPTLVSDHKRLLVTLGEGCHASHQPSDARRVTLPKIKEDPMCPLCGEEYMTPVFYEDVVLSVGNEEKFGKQFLVPGELRQEHLSLKSAKTPKGSIVTLKVNSGMHIGPTGGLSSRR